MSAEDRLARYRRMRDLSATPEPGGEEHAPPPGEHPRFVVQQHDATRLHWDLRLERDGVLVSWALTRGLPWRPGEDRGAVHTEDHPLEYLWFSGDIPAGQYGAGTMVIWDHGTYEEHTFTDRKVVVTLHGAKVEGTYALFPIRDRDWLVHRMDPPQDPQREPLPDDLRPMRAGSGTLPDGDGWAFEIRWRGLRALLTNDAGRVTVVDAAGCDVTGRFPEVRRVGRALAATEVVLDGVVVGLGPGGRPSVDPGAVERRVGAHERRTRRLAEDAPTAFLAVDLLWREGHPTTTLPYEDRRWLLDELDLEGPAWQTPSHHVGNGALLLDAAREQGLPGLVAKRLGSPYRPGELTDDWREVPVW